MNPPDPHARRFTVSVPIIVDAVMVIALLNLAYCQGQQADKVEQLQRDKQTSAVTDGRIVRIETRLDQLQQDTTELKAGQARIETAVRHR